MILLRATESSWAVNRALAVLTKLVPKCLRGCVLAVSQLGQRAEELGLQSIELGAGFCLLGLDLLDPDPDGSGHRVLVAPPPRGRAGWRVGRQPAGRVEQVNLRSQCLDSCLRGTHCLLSVRAERPVKG